VHRMVKEYDRAYFDKWYRREGFGSRVGLDRKVRYALSAAEYLLQRPVRSVLDVGCGEGAWQPALAKLRPRARYVGIDPSAYAVGRYGSRRNLRLGGMGDLDALGLDGSYDVVVCVDVVPYVSNADAKRGLDAIGRLLSGVALIELFTSSDDFGGDMDGYRRRSPSTYRAWFEAAGLERIGPNLFVGMPLSEQLTTFERGT
jgi:SAM-dependent methyltransferase